MTSASDQAKTLKIVFAGTPDFAAGHLQGLLDAGFDVQAVYCQPDRRKGRGKKLLPPATKTVAEAHQIPVYQPLNFKNAEDVQTLHALHADLMIVVAYGLLLPKHVLEIPRYGCINVHASLLPRWRGAAPVERSIEAGDVETGITIMQMDEGLDTGDMLMIRRLPITADTTGDSLRKDLLPVGLDALIESLNQLVDGQLQPETQDDSQASYAAKLNKDQARLNWQQSADILDRQIRAFTGSNVCSMGIDGMRIKVWAATALPGTHNREPGQITDISKHWIDIACGEGWLRLTRLQLPNAKAMDVTAVLNGKGDLFKVGKRVD